MEKNQTKKLYVDQTKSGAKPLNGFANLVLALGIVVVVLAFALTFIEVFEYIQLLTLGAPVFLSALFVYYFCRGLATIVENAAIQKAIALDKCEKEGLIIYEKEA